MAPPSALVRKLERIGAVLALDTGSDQEYLDHVLEEAIAVTESRIGYIYHYDEDTEQFVLNSWSRSAMSQCEVQERQTAYLLRHTGLWGEAVRQRRPIVANDFGAAAPRKGLPAGHVALERFLTIPVFVEGRIVGVVGVANKESDYDASDTQLLTVLMSAVWKSLRRRKAEQDYQTLFHEMINGFALHEILCDKDGVPVDYTFLDVNPAFERMTGLSRAEIVGRRVTEALPTVEPRLIGIYGRVALTGVPVHLEESFETLGKSFEIMAFRPSPGRFATFFVDVTERERARAELRESEDRRRQAEKMEALGMLAGGIAHDFNNILGAIQGFAELSQDLVDPESPVGENLSRIMRAGKRARKLVERIQLYRRASEPRRNAVLLGALVDEVVEQLRGVAAAGIEIECAVDREAVVEVEPTQIHEVFLNLGMNALNAMDGKGRLAIRMRRVLEEAERVSRIGVRKPGWHVAVEFVDTGCGMDSSIQRKAFDPFFTTRRVGDGSGLGLAVVQGIVQAHGGALDVESRVGEGSVFRLWLPLSTSVVNGKETPAPFLSEGGGGRILVADDEAVLLDFYRQALERHGYEVRCVQNGAEALGALRAEPSSFDLLLTDQSMPGMSGMDLSRMVRELAPGLPILMCTGHGPDADEVRPGTTAISRILSKPVEMSRLLRTVGELLEASRKPS